MAKKKPKIEDEEFLEDEEEEVEEASDSTDEEGGLTYKMRYTVSILQPQKSSEGSKCYKDFYETDKLADAKSEAEAAFKEDKLEVTIWDREHPCDDPIRYSPEVKDDDDDATTTEPAPKKALQQRKIQSLQQRKIRASAKSDGGRPKPKHPRRSVDSSDQPAAKPKPKHPRRKSSK